MPKLDTFIKIDVDGQPAVREFSKMEDAVKDVDKQVDKLDDSINDLAPVDIKAIQTFVDRDVPPALVP